MMQAREDIASRLSEVRDRVAVAARRARRESSSVQIVLASKTQPPEAIRAAHIAGARDFGENYVQEAASKQHALADIADLRWHLIGHLQTNKARQAAVSFTLIHSLDSPRLAAALSRARPVPPMPVLVEVNAAGEGSKSGVPPEDVERLIDAVRGSVDVRGLMTVPPLAPAAEESRRYFSALRELRERLAVETGLALSELSMGMSDDFEVAIEEGATIVRIGRAVFGERAQ